MAHSAAGLVAGSILRLALRRRALFEPNILPIQTQNFYSKRYKLGSINPILPDPLVCCNPGTDIGRRYGHTSADKIRYEHSEKVRRSVSVPFFVLFPFFALPPSESLELFFVGLPQKGQK